MDQSLYSPISGAASTKLRVLRGLVVLSTELAILHINKPAADLARYLRRQERGSTTGQLLPGPWLELGEEIREAMEREEAAHHGRAIQVRRTISVGDRSIVLSGFGLIAGDGPEHSRLVLMTEEHCPEHLAPTDHLRYRFLFTHIRAAREVGADAGPDGRAESD